MNTLRTLLRVHAHAWFVSGYCALAAASLVYLKALQVHFELQVDQPSLGEPANWELAWSSVVSRRLDNPSLWALVAVVIAAWMLTRAMAHYAEANPLPTFLWTRRLRYWMWLFAMMGLSLTAYVVVGKMKNEVYWYAGGAEHAKYLHTPIPFIQAVEGTLNVVGIVLACSLVPAVRAIGDLLRADPDQTPSVLRARARLATMAVGPFALLATVFTIYKVVRTIAVHSSIGTGIPVVHTFRDIVTGTVGSMFVCSPMIIATWELWWFPKRNGITLRAMSTLALIVWGAVCLVRRDVISPPKWILDEGALPQSLQVPARVARFLGVLGSGVFLWFDS